MHEPNREASPPSTGLDVLRCGLVYMQNTESSYDGYLQHLCCHIACAQDQGVQSRPGLPCPEAVAKLGDELCTLACGEALLVAEDLFEGMRTLHGRSKLMQGSLRLSHNPQLYMYAAPVQIIPTRSTHSTERACKIAQTRSATR